MEFLFVFGSLEVLRRCCYLFCFDAFGVVAGSHN